MDLRWRGRPSKAATGGSLHTRRTYERVRMPGPAGSAQTAMDLSIAGRMVLRARAVVSSRSVVVTGAAVAGLVCLIAVLVGGAGAARSVGARAVDVGAGSQLPGSTLAASGGVVSSARRQRLVVAQAARRRRWLESPGVRAQQAASQMAFHDLPPGAAEQLSIHDYGSALAGVAANPAASLARMGRVVRYMGNDRA